MRSRRPRGRPLLLELLEDRLAPASITVLTNGDATGSLSGSGGVFTAPTLRAAIDGANAMAGADTITFGAAVFGQTITAVLNDTTNPFAFGPTAFVINSDITIAGDVAQAGVTISGNNSHRLFGIMTGATLTLQFVTLTGGNAIGGNGGSGAGGGGAGLGGAIFNNGTLNVFQSTLTGNSATGGTGGNNSFGPGGGGGAAGFSGGASVSYPAGGAGVGGAGVGVFGPGSNNGGNNESGTFAGPGANGTAGGGGGGGGGGFTGSGGNGLSLSSGGFGGGGGGSNSSGGAGGFGGGGGGFGGAGGFGGGGAGGGGGGGASGGFGGGAGNSTPMGGGGAGLGGAIFNNGGTVAITNSTLTSNIASGGAGGSHVGPSGAPGKGLGGAVFNLNGTLTLLNSTLSGNTAAQGGGGIYNRGSTTSGSGYSTGTGTVNMSNTIVANSTGGVTDFAGSGTQAFGAGNATNLIRSNSGFVGTGTITGTNPLLSALGTFGGPTQTFALLPGSPAINAGTNAGAPVTDQRGVSRPQQSTVDIGAFESQGFTIALTSGNNQTTTAGQSFAAPLVVTVSSVGEPVAGGVVTFTGPGSGASTNPAVNTAAIAADGTASLSVTANSAGGLYTVSATASGVTGSANFSLTNVVPTPTFGALAPAEWTAGVAYSGTIGISDGTAPFTLVSTTLPAGYNASLSGTTITVTNANPSAATVNFTVTIQDGSSVSFTSGTQTLTVNPAATFGVLAPAAWTAGVAYSGTIGISDGTGPFSLLSTTLPAGYDAVLSGSTITVTNANPSAATVNFTVTIQDASGGSFTSGTQTLTVNPAPTFGALIPGGGAAGVAYSGTIAISNGTAPFTLDSTTLPAGYSASLSGSTITVSNANPSVATVHFTVTISDASGGSFTSGTQTLSIGGLIDDPDLPGKKALAVNGTPGDDIITVTAQLSPAIVVTANGINVVTSTAYVVTINGGSPLTFSGVTGRIIVNAFDGNNVITVAPAVTKGCLLIAGSGDDSITGGAGNDTIDSGTGNDTLRGGSGSDRLIVAGDVDFTLSNTFLTRSSGGFYSLTSVEQASLTGGGGNNAINTSAFTGKVTLDGGAGADSLTAGPGNDVLTGGLGDDTFNGGGGIDRLVEVGDNFTLVGGTALVDGSLTGLGTDVLVKNSIETAQLTGGAGGDTINTLAFHGNVTLDGGAGDDVLISGKGNDNLSGGADNDTLTAGLGNDTLDGGIGTDRLIESGNVSFTLTNVSLTGLGADKLSSLEEGGLTGGAAANVFALNTWTGTTTVTGGGGADKLALTHDTDFVLDSTLGQIARSTAGTIQLTAIPRVSVTGGAGNNRFDVTNWSLGSTTLKGGAGTDTLVASNLASTTLTNLLLTRTAAIKLAAFERAQLTADNNGRTINASAFTGRVTLTGGNGADSLVGGSGHDVLLGGFGADTLNGNAGRDFLIGGDDTDSLLGGTGEDVLANGTTTYNVFSSDFASIMAEWERTDIAYGLRVTHLTTGGGLNGSNFLNPATLVNDGFNDVLTGGTELDWFFALQPPGDVLTDRLPTEQLN